MMCHGHARLHFANDIPAAFHRDLRDWSSREMGGEFTADEELLFRSVALSYANPVRPSMRQLYQTLCKMIDEDEIRSGIQTSKPSASIFRRLILSLPSDFVDYMRYGQRADRFAIFETARPFVDRSGL